MSRNKKPPLILEKILEVLDSVKPAFPDITEEVKVDQVNESFDVITVKYDERYFTIVIDDNKWYCVEFYRYRSDALIGHESWIRKLHAGLRSIIALTFDACFPYSEIELKPFSDRKKTQGEQ